MPSFNAALVAYIASSTLSFFSFNSTLELAPTFTTPTFPDNIASLSCSFFFKNGDFSFFMAFLTLSTRSVRSLPRSIVVITVFTAFVTAFSTFPKQSIVIKSISSPNSSFIIVAPVKKAKSCTVSVLVGPKPGKSTILTFILPLTLFISKAALTCCSTGATISSGRLCFITCSSIGCILRMLGILLPTIKTSGSSSTDSCLSTSVRKCGDVRPQSNCTPSTIST